MKNVIKVALICLLITSLYGNKEKLKVIKENSITNSNNNNDYLNPKDESKLHSIGIYKEDGKIIIDLNKTKKLLNNFATKLREEGIKIKDKTKDINISLLGIKIDKEKIKVDLNKTKNFLEKFSKIIEDVAKDFNKSINR